MIILRYLIPLSLVCFLLPGLVMGSLLSERTYKRLNQIHKLIEKEDYSGALSRLDKLMNQSGSREYDKAIIQQTFGYVYEAMDQPAKAIETYEASLSSGVLPVTAAQGVRLNLANLYYMTGKTRKALDIFEVWYEAQKSPSARALVFGGSLYAESNNYTKAVSYIKKAIKISSNPKESWYRRLAAIHIKMEEYSKASKILEILVSKYPNKLSYWKQLSACNYYLGDEVKSLSVMLLAYEKGLLKTSKEYLDLARFAASQEMPYKASQIIEEGVNKGLVSKERINVELLGNIYMQAQEHDRAIETYTEAAELSNDSKYYIKVAELYSNSQQWDKVLKVIDEHLSEKAEHQGRVLILKGIALYEMNKIVEAKKVFDQASSMKENREIAYKWQQYLNQVSVN